MPVHNSSVVDQFIDEEKIHDRFGKIYISRSVLDLMDNPRAGLYGLTEAIQRRVEHLTNKKNRRFKRYVFTVEEVYHPWFRDTCIKISWRSL